LDVEIGEENEKHGAVEKNDVTENDGKTTVDKDGLNGVDKESCELDHLQLGEVFLPPEELLDLGTAGSQEVVEVHEGVDAHVEEPAEGCMTSANISDATPCCERHNSMVNNMKSGEMIILLSQHKKEGVNVVDEL